MLLKKSKIKTLHDALSVNVTHMWRTSAKCTLEDQINVRWFRMNRIKELPAPFPMLNNEIRLLNGLIRKYNKENPNVNLEQYDLVKELK
jgi:hypothetical protein